MSVGIFAASLAPSSFAGEAFHPSHHVPLANSNNIYYHYKITNSLKNVYSSYVPQQSQHTAE